MLPVTAERSLIDTVSEEYFRGQNLISVLDFDRSLNSKEAR